MVTFFFLFVLGLIGFVLIGSILGFTASKRIQVLERQNLNLNQRLLALEGKRAPIKSSEEAPQVKVDPQPAPAAPAPVPEPKPEFNPAPVPLAVAAAVPAKREAVQASTSKPTPKIKTKPTPKPKRNLEDLIGGQWSVWVGGFALLVGAVLLIRFSIEAGVFGPGARIFMATVLGVALLLAGEWLKRSDDKVLKGKLGQGKLGETAKALQSNASVPGLLSAVGIFTLLGTTYAARELYGFLSAPVSFVILGVISLAAMALSLRQGPLLALIGLLASFATPLLIQTQIPSFMALVGYLLVIGVAALALARRTKWRWLEAGTVFGWLAWSFVSIPVATHNQLLLWSVFLAIGFAVTVWRSDQLPAKRVSTRETRPSVQFNDLELRPALSVIWGAVAAILVIYVVLSLNDWNSVALPVSAIILSLVSLGALLAAAVMTKHQSVHLLTAGVLSLSLGFFNGPSSQILIFGAVTFLVVLLSLRQAYRVESGNLFKEGHYVWPVFAVGLGLGNVISAMSFNSTTWSNTAYAVWALVYCAIFAAGAFYFRSKSRSPLIIACLTLGAGLAWWLASAIAFDGLHLSLSLSVGAMILAIAIWRLDLFGARLAFLGLIGLVFAHAFLVQFHMPDSLSSRPIFNALWAYLALPAAILGVAAFVLRGREMERHWPRFFNAIIEAAALAGLALFIVFQIRHLSNDGSVYADKLGFAELGLQVSTGLCFTLAGLSKRFSGNIVLSKMAEIISYATLALFAVGSLFGLSPLFNNAQEVTGNFVFNSLTTGLLVPTALLALCAFWARQKRSDQYINILGGLALAGMIAWVTAMIRFIFNGADISIFNTRFDDLELWTISAVWLAMGIGLLAAGVWKQERALRIASGIVIILTVLKAFLIDMAGLEGVLRAVSFVVLGLVLIVIGRAYQRYWLSDRSQDGESTEAA